MGKVHFFQKFPTFDIMGEGGFIEAQLKIHFMSV